MTGGALLLAAALTTACSPEPAPTPTPTGFASEEEAFEAAEATYRAYVDAANQVDLSEPATFEPVYATLSGEALDAAKTSFTQMHADEWVVDGQSVVKQIVPERLGQDSVRLSICVDVGSVTLVDSTGASQVQDRPQEQALAAIVDNDDGSWSISSFSGRDGDPECKR